MKILEKLKREYTNGAVTIAFFGDSITQGCFESRLSVHSMFDFENVYHNKIKKELNRQFPTLPINIINAGIGGDTAESGFCRIKRDVLSKTPDLTVVCFGLNDVCSFDTISTFTSSLEKIFKILKDNMIETIFMTPNMLNTYVSDDISEVGLKEIAAKTATLQNNGKMDKFISAAVKSAEKYDIPVADCYKIWKNMYENGIDTTLLLANRINHPTREMHNIFADEVLKTMFK